MIISFLLISGETFPGGHYPPLGGKASGAAGIKFIAFSLRRT
jgi:hypothetical protein